MARHYFISYIVPQTWGQSIGHALMKVEESSLKKICENIKESNKFENLPVITFFRELDEDEYNMLKGE